LPLAAFVTVDLALGTHPGLVVPAHAVVDRQDGPVVYVITDGSAHARRVTLAPDSGAPTREVKTGLKPGERVATEGAYELSDGARVTLGGAQ
jgi:multidrug efflux system membrane fusion protein